MKRKARLRRHTKAAIEKRLEDEARTTLQTLDYVYLGASPVLIVIAAALRSDWVLGLSFVALGVSLGKIEYRCHRVGIVRTRVRRGLPFFSRRQEVLVRRSESPVQYSLLIGFLSIVVICIVGLGLSFCLRSLFARG
jgi:hypothetical protein